MLRFLRSWVLPAVLGGLIAVLIGAVIALVKHLTHDSDPETRGVWMGGAAVWTGQIGLDVANYILKKARAHDPE